MSLLGCNRILLKTTINIGRVNPACPFQYVLLLILPLSTKEDMTQGFSVSSDLIVAHVLSNDHQTVHHVVWREYSLLATDLYINPSGTLY